MPDGKNEVIETLHAGESAFILSHRYHKPFLELRVRLEDGREAYMLFEGSQTLLYYEKHGAPTE